MNDFDYHAGKREPRTEFRQAAAEMHEIYVSLVDAGFSEAQAMQIIGYTFAAQFGGGQ